MKTAIVIPCYNEETRFLSNSFIAYYNQSDIHFCFVNDGSVDNTIELLKNLRKSREDRIHIIDRKINKGKAESVREGMFFLHKKNNFDWIGFFDADFATPLVSINLLVGKASKNDNIKVVIGSRFKHLGAIIKRSYSRFFFGRVFATIVSISLNLDVYDTQCGLKIFRKDIIDSAFEKPFLSKWLFDVEILFRLINYYGKDIVEKVVVECPLLDWREVNGSKLKFKDIITIPFEILKINRYYYHKK